MKGSGKSEFRYEMQGGGPSWECTRCGSLVRDTDKHDEWHALVAPAAEQ